MWLPDTMLGVTEHGRRTAALAVAPDATGEDRSRARRSQASPRRHDPPLKQAAH